MVRLILGLRAVIGLRAGGFFLLLMSLGTGADLLCCWRDLGSGLRSAVDWPEIKLKPKSFGVDTNTVRLRSPMGACDKV
jgi:hypothetical protein